MESKQSSVSVQSQPSPRSTVLAGSDLMTTNLSSMNESNIASEIPTGTSKVSMPQDGSISDTGVNPAATSSKESATGGPSKNHTATSHGSENTMSGYHSSGGIVDPSQRTSSTPHTVPGNHSAYSQSQVTPEPTTPAQVGVTTISYDATTSSFFRQQNSFIPQSSPFAGPTTPLSPPRVTISATHVAGIPPASPLFPRPSAMMESGQQQQQQQRAPQSPSLPYMSPSLSGAAVYTGYPVAVNSQANGSNDGSAAAWGENR